MKHIDFIVHFGKVRVVVVATVVRRETVFVQIYGAPWRRNIQWLVCAGRSCWHDVAQFLDFAPEKTNGFEQRAILILDLTKLVRLPLATLRLLLALLRLILAKLFDDSIEVALRHRVVILHDAIERELPRRRRLMRWWPRARGVPSLRKRRSAMLRVAANCQLRRRLGRFAKLRRLR